MGRRKRFGVGVERRILSMGLLISFYSFYSVYAATRGSEFYGTGHIRPVVVVVVVFDGVGGLLCSPRPEPPMGHMAVLG